MKADQGGVKSAAALNWISYGRPANDQALVQNTGEIPQRFKLIHSCDSLGVRDLRSEFQEYWRQLRLFG